MWGQRSRDGAAQYICTAEDIGPISEDGRVVTQEIPVVRRGSVVGHLKVLTATTIVDTAHPCGRFCIMDPYASSVRLARVAIK